MVTKPCCQRGNESPRSLFKKSTLEVQILAYLTVSWIGGNVAVHVRKVDNPECKVIRLIVDADMERCVCTAHLDIGVEITHFSR